MRPLDRPPLRALGAALRLARWLGPWTEESRAPSGIRREQQEITRGERRFPAWTYRRSGRLIGSILLVPGLHYAGPMDPRLDRFARILAEAGYFVLSPLLPDFSKLLVTPALAEDTEAAFEALLGHPERPRGSKPGVISISFGSYSAIALAGSSRHAEGIGGLLLFGGFSSFMTAIRFALTGGGGLPHDPLNRPVVFLNLLAIGKLRGAPSDPEPIAAAWRAFVERTWGRPEMKAIERYRPIAEELAAALPDEERALFLSGCGVSGEGLPALPEGGTARALDSLKDAGEAFSFLDPSPHARGVRCPVHVVHGRDDDVIPYTEAEDLMKRFPKRVGARAWLTGLYAHTGHTEGEASQRGLLASLRGAPLLAKELLSMTRILGAMASIGVRATEAASK